MLSSFRLVILLLCISTVVFRANAKASKLSRLGARAPAVPSRLPLGTRQPTVIHLPEVPGILMCCGIGFGVSLQLIRRLRTNSVLEWNQKILNVPGRTVEIHMVGVSMIMTDNVENIRAIMSTQVKSKLESVYDTTIELRSCSSSLLAKVKRITRFGAVS
jgi:hypothetical protein